MQSSTGIWRWASSSIRSVSWAAVKPWPMRSARRLSAPQMDSGGPSLAGVRGQSQALVRGVAVDAAEEFRRRFQFVAANADADDVAVAVARGQFEHLLRFFDSEVAGGVEDPEQRHAEIAGTTGASAFQTFEDGGEILLAEEADADRNIDLGMQDVFFFQALHEAVGDEFVIVGTAQMGAHRS